MFIKLLPEQIVKIWDPIKLAIIGTFVQRDKCSGAYLSHVLKNLLTGKSQCWAGFKTIDGERKLACFLITRISFEDGIGEKILFIDALYGFNGVPGELFEEGWTILSEFARQSDCKAIVSLTDNERVKAASIKVGFSTRTYLVKEV